MKKFENKTTEILAKDKDNADYNLGYAELAANILDIMPAEGWSTDTMRQRIPLQAKLKELKINKTILLENAEIETLHTIFASKPKFKMIHQNIIDLEDYIIKLKHGPDEKISGAAQTKKR